jgi:hypothetical protein
MMAGKVQPGGGPPGTSGANYPAEMDKPVTPPRSPQHERPAGVAGGGGAPTDQRPPSSHKN